LSAIRPVTEQVTPTLSVDGTHARPVPVMATAMKATPASVQFAADKAASAGKLLMIVKTAAPIGLYTLGLALIIVAIVRRRKPARPRPPYLAQSRRLCMRDLVTRRRSSPVQLRATSPQSKSDSSLAELRRARGYGVKRNVHDGKQEKFRPLI
jgi:hypothetical protein